jgi:hypothetical protein
MSGSTTLNGFLQTTTTEITAAQLLALLGAPIQLAGPNSPSQAALLRSLIVSLRFGSAPFTNPSGRAGACVCYGSGLPTFGGGGNIPGFTITQITMASGVCTLTVPGLAGAGNVFAGCQAGVSFATHSGNNGTFNVVSSANGSLVVSNAGAITETPVDAQLVLNYPSAAGGGLLGGGSGIGDVNDLAVLLGQAEASELVWIPVSGFSGLTSSIAGQPILLMNPLPRLVNPNNLVGGDSTLLITSEFLVVEL